MDWISTFCSVQTYTVSSYTFPFSSVVEECTLLCYCLHLYITTSRKTRESTSWEGDNISACDDIAGSPAGFSFSGVVSCSGVVFCSGVVACSVVFAYSIESLLGFPVLFWLAGLMFVLFKASVGDRSWTGLHSAFDPLLQWDVLQQSTPTHSLKMYVGKFY